MAKKLAPVKEPFCFRMWASTPDYTDHVARIKKQLAEKGTIVRNDIEQRLETGLQVHRERDEAKVYATSLKQQLRIARKEIRALNGDAK